VSERSVSLSDPMGIALDEARAAAGRGEVPIGAVIVRDGTILARDGNRTLERDDPTAHAEMLVIRAAAAGAGSQRLAGADLYVTLEPCTMCAAAISFARIRRLYFGAEDDKGGAVDNGVRFFRQPTCHHAPEVYGGMAARESGEMLKAFFRRLRDKNGQRDFRGG
jgi:tRNA(adenine34) deaminase